MKRWCVVLVVFLLGLLGAGLPAAENGFDGAQIQKFIDEAVERGGGEVVLPPGVHELRQSLVIPAHVRLRLVGLEAEQVWLTVAEGVEVDFPLLVVEAGDAVVAPDEDGKKAEGGRILVEKLTFKTQAAGETAVVVGEGEGVPLLRVDVGSGAGRVEVRRCFFERHGGHGVVLAAGNRVEVGECVFMDLGGHGILVEGGAEVLLENNHLTRCAGGEIHVAEGVAVVGLDRNELR